MARSIKVGYDFQSISDMKGISDNYSSKVKKLKNQHNHQPMQTTWITWIMTKLKGVL